MKDILGYIFVICILLFFIAAMQSLSADMCKSKGGVPFTVGFKSGCIKK